MEARKRQSEPLSLKLVKGDCLKLVKSLPTESVDLVLTSPPYCIGKKYENEKSAADFVENHEKILPQIARITKKGGTICWQVGYHITNGVVTPLDYLIFNIFSQIPGIHLRNRIIWTFGHGLHPSSRFSGRHETLLWFTKGSVPYTFNLDDVRVPQKYPGKLAYKGDKKGKPSGNPKGKNPSDVWDIPNVKANHVEKTEHPCQFPIEIARRVIKAFSNVGDLVIDPYLGSGTSAIAAAQLHRNFWGCEINAKYLAEAKKRVSAAQAGTLKYREDHIPVYEPKSNTPLTTIPKGWFI